MLRHLQLKIPFLFRRNSICLLAFSFILAFCSTTFADEFGQLKKQAEKAMKHGEFEQAEKIWQELLAQKPNQHELRLRLSYALYKQKKLVESYQEAEKVAFFQPNNPQVYSLIGATFLGAGNFTRAKEAYNHAFSLNPDEPLALAGAGMIDFHENRTKAGIAKLRRAIYLDSREPDFWYYLAQVASRLEYYKEAANAFKRFLQVSPNTDVDRRTRIQGLIEFLRYIGSQKNLYEQSGKNQTSVSCEIINNRPVIPVRINGSGETLKFVLDTGAGITVISEDAPQKLGLKPVARGGKARAVGGNGKFDIVYGFLNSMEIGDAKINKVPIYIRKFYQTDYNIDGYLGVNAISKYLTTLDYANNYFSLNKLKKEENETDEADSGQAPVNDLNIPLRITSSGFLSGEVKFDGIAESFNFIVDTGASVTVVSENLSQYYRLSRFAQTTLLRVYGAAGVTENVVSLNLPKIFFGVNSREKLQAAVLDLSTINENVGFEQNGILGGNFFNNYRLTFNFRKARLLLEPTRPASKKTATDAIISE